MSSNKIIYTVNSPKVVLGHGTNSEVVAGMDDKKNPVAIKLVTVSNTGVLKTILREIQLYKYLKHPNIMNILDCSVQQGEEVVQIVMPRCRYSLKEYLAREYPRGIDDVQMIATILKSVLEALVYLHANRVIHRDIKASNILVTKDGKFTLSDFGISKIMTKNDQKSTHTFVGTVLWMAPEVMEDSYNGYSFPADIWSLGITALELAYGRPPYANLPPLKILLNILTKPPVTTDYYKDTGIKCNKSFKNFIKCIMKRKPSERPSAKKLLSHKFIKTYADKVGTILGTILATKNIIIPR